MDRRNFLSGLLIWLFSFFIGVLYGKSDLVPYKIDKTAVDKDDESKINQIENLSNDILQRGINAVNPPAPLKGISTTDADIGPNLQAILNYAKTVNNVPVLIPAGTYYQKSTVTIMSYQKLIAIGNVTIDTRGFGGTVYRIKNNDTKENQGYDSSFNTKSLDAIGSLFIFGDKTSGSVAIKIGNDNNYSGAQTYFSSFSGAANITIAGFDIGIKRTNNNTFCIRWENVRISNCNRCFQLEASSKYVNSGELDTFINCFFNNSTYGLEFLHGGEFSFIGCSIDFCQLGVRFANPKGVLVFHFTGGHIEKSNLEFFNGEQSNKAIINMTNTLFIPSSYASSGTWHRSYFKGNIELNTNGITFLTDTFTDKVDHLFKCNESVKIRNQIENSGETYSLTSKDRNRLINNDFSNNLTGYKIRERDKSKFTIVTNKYFSGSKSLKCVTNGYIQIDTPMSRKNNLVDCLIDFVFNAGGVTRGGINIIVMCYDQNKSHISSTSPIYTKLSEYTGIDSFKKRKTAFIPKLPNGTEYIVLRLSTSSNFSGTLYIDSIWLE